MKKLLKWIGVVVAVLVVVGIGLVLAANLLFERKRERVIKLDVKTSTRRCRRRCVGTRQVSVHVARLWRLSRCERRRPRLYQ